MTKLRTRRLVVRPLVHEDAKPPCVFRAGPDVRRHLRENRVVSIDSTDFAP